MKAEAGQDQGWGTRVVRAVAVIAVIAAALLAGWAALHEAAVRAFSADTPIVRAVAADDPRVVGTPPAVRSLETLTRPIDPAVRHRVVETLASLPLAAEPFTAEAQGAFQDGDLARSTRLLEVARHRAPRDRVARWLLLDRYARAERLPAAVGEIATLNRLIPDASGILVNVIAQIAALPEGPASVRRVLRTDPVLANAVLGRLAARGDDPAAVLALARGLPTRVGVGRPDWRDALVGAMVGRGDYVAARLLWQRGARAPAGVRQDGGELVYDGVFRGGPGRPPFGWTGIDGGAGAVDWRRRGGIALSFYGRQSGTLLGQLLTLAPGSYRLRYADEEPVTANGSAIAWRVRCDVPSAAGPSSAATTAQPAPLLDLPVRAAAGAGGFTVPRGCLAQRLTLDGIAGEFPQEINASLVRVAVTRASAAR